MSTFLEEIKRQVLEHPDVPALVGQGVSFSYGELWELANSFAFELKDKGCKSGDVVAISIGNHPYHIVAILSVALANGVFLPLDEPIPKTRKEEILLDSGAKYVIKAEDITHHQIRITSLDVPVTKENEAAYLVYTSGSTGRPKGVLVAHRGYLPMLKAQKEAFQMRAGKRSLLTLSVSFDASLSDIGVALISGATLVVEKRTVVSQPRELLATIRKHGITHLDLPPALLSVIEPQTMPGCIETIVFGGEPCPPKKIRLWAKRFRMINVYGPTEATICVSLCKCDSIDWVEPLIGRPLPHVNFAILDENDNPVEIGDRGELHIGGPAVALRYLNEDEFMKKRFYEKGGIPFFRTGDLIRQRANGDLVFCGRNDEQVKIGGLRLQLEEVEAHLRSHGKVKRAAVIKRANRLEAFIVAPKETSDKELRHHLLDFLPQSLLPSTFHILDELPETSSGKIDKSALKKLSKSKTTKVTFQSNLEKRLCQIIENVLNKPVQGANNFNAVGGNSILALEIAARATDENINLPPSWLEAGKTIAHIARRLEQEKPQPRAMSRNELFNDSRPSPTLLPLLGTKAPTPLGSIPKTILLTGASGFLGSFVLQELLKKTATVIYCLCRSKVIESPGERVFTIRGDLTQPRFGLDDTTWNSLKKQVDTVFHCAASISNVATYERIRSTNVFGTEEILRFCLEGRAKKLHYASTLSVFVASDRKDEVFYERDELKDNCMVFGGYGQSKYAAELLLRSVSPCLPLVTIHRFGLLTGEGNPNCIVKRLLQNGEVIPKEKDVKVDITPVEYAAEVMVLLALRAKESCTFHISAGAASAAQLRDIWSKRKNDLKDAQTTLGLCRFKNSYDAFRDLDIFQATKVTFDTSHCDEQLKNSDVKKPEITDELLMSYSLSSSSSK